MGKIKKMAETKVVVADVKVGKSYQKVMEENPFLNMKLGDKFSGADIGLEGYELEITGGSDNAGFPIRKDLPGVAKKRIIITGGPGLRLHKVPDGGRVKKTVHANHISDKIAQVNVKVLKYGSKSIPDAFGITPKEEEKPAEEAAAVEAPKEKAKPEEKPAEAAAEPEPAKEEAKPKEAPKE